MPEWISVMNLPNTSPPRAADAADTAAKTMPVYYINLDRRPERMAHMQQQGLLTGVALIRMPAVDASDPGIQQAAQTRRPGLDGRRMGAGSIACYESHRACWRALVSSKATHAIVLEDDVLLAPDFAELAQQPGWVPADADVIKIDTWKARVHLAAGKPIQVGPRELRRLRSTHFGAAGYVIACETAERLLPLTEDTSDPIDDTLFRPDQPHFPALTVYQMTPAPVVQVQHEKKESSPSLLAATSITDRFTAIAEPSRETPVARLRRRLANEWHALRSGTRYVVVPHG
jgi:glycosyl transferase, family 25